MKFTKFSLLALLPILLAGATACASGPDARAGTLSGIIDEVRVGRSCAARIAKQYGLVQNANAVKYLNNVAGGMGALSRPELSFLVGVLDSNEVNVFACPGGYLFITKGAIAKLGDEAELAFALGVGVGHVALRNMSQYTVGVTPRNVESAVDDLVPVLTEKGLGSSAVAAADQAALVYLSTLGYEISAASRAIEKLSAGGSAYGKLHPAAASRASALGEFATTNGLRAGATNNEARYRASLGRL
jgi:beta-barrel assembly-enhancing protease